MCLPQLTTVSQTETGGGSVNYPCFEEEETERETIGVSGGSGSLSRSPGG